MSDSLCETLKLILNTISSKLFEIPLWCGNPTLGT